MSGTDPGGAFEISLFNKDFFTNALNDDLNIRTMLPRQRILMGTTSNADAAMMITSNTITLSDNVFVKSKLGVGRSNFDVYPVDIIGNTAIDGNVNMTKYVLCRGVQLRKKSGSYYAPTELPIGSVQGVSNDALGMNLYIPGGAASNYFLFRAAGNEVLRVTGDGTLRIPQRMFIGSNILWSTQSTLSLNDTLYATQLTGRIGIGTTTPAATLDVTGTDAVYLPRGTTNQRPVNAQQGFIRYNTTLGAFEGYASGNTWGSLGGVKDTNQDTFVSAETFPTSNDDAIRFINSNQETMRMTQQGLLGIGTSNPSERVEVAQGNAKMTSNMFVLGRTALGHSNPLEALDVEGNSRISSNLVVGFRSVVGASNITPSEALDVQGNAKMSSNAYVMSRIGVSTSNPTVSLELNTTDAILLPRGTTAQRPQAQAQGQIRYNTTLSTFEGCGPGNTWGSLGGVKDTNQDTYITPEIVTGSNDDILRFYNSNTETMRLQLSNLEVNVPSSIYKTMTLLPTQVRPANTYVPPSTSVTSSNFTVTGQAYGNGAYAILGSSVLDAGQRYEFAFDQSASSRWISAQTFKGAGNTYNSNVVTAAANNGSNYPGDWIQITIPDNIVPTRLKLLTGVGAPTYAIDTFTLLGSSNNGTTWKAFFSSLGNTSWPQTANSNLAFNYFINEMDTFNMFRMVVFKSYSDLIHVNYMAIDGYTPAPLVPPRLGVGLSNPTEIVDITGNIKASSNVYAMSSIGVGNSNPSEPLDVYGNIKVSSNMYVMSNLGIGLSNPSVALEVLGSTIMRSNLEVRGDLTVLGATTMINATTVNIADNIIRLNNGAVYTNSLQAGIEVNRGTGYNSYSFVFDEDTQYFRVGLQGSLQTVATRDDSPPTNSVAVYDAPNKKYTGCNGLTYSNNILIINPIANNNVIQAFFPTLTNAQTLSMTLGQTSLASNATQIRYVQGATNPACVAQFGLIGFNHITCQGNGMVGINNVSPSNRLDVAGNVRVSHNQNLHLSIQDGSGTSTNSVFMDFNNANTTARGIIGLDGAGFRNSSAGALTLATWTNHDMLFLTNQNERMRITSGGNVGIGITPIYPLDVRTGTANSVVARFSDASTELVVNPSKRFTSNVSGWTTLDPNGGTTSGVAFWDNIAVSGGLAVGSDATYGQASVASGNIIASGNIGAGTTNPQSRLDVVGNVRIAHTSAAHMTMCNASGVSANAVFMDMFNSDASARGIIGLDGTGYLDTSRGALLLSTWTNNNILFATNQLERMRMTSNGNFGIGTTLPQYRLHVSGVSYFPDGIISPGIHAQWNMTGGGTVTWGSNKLLWSQRIVVAPVERAELGTNGFFDITCPTSGTIQVFTSTDTITTVTCDAGGIPINDWYALYYEITPGQASTSDNSRFRLIQLNNTVWRPTTNWLLIACTNWDNQSLKWMPGNAYLSSGATFTSTGTGTGGGGSGVGWVASGSNIVTMSNVGIGITIPLTRLHVAGPGTILDASTTGDHRMLVCKQNAANTASMIFCQGGNTSNNGMAEIGLTGSNSLAFRVNATAGTYVTRMLITSNNMGIGTSTPQGALHITQTNMTSNQVVIEASSLADGTSQGISAINFNGYSTSSSRVRFNAGKNHWRMVVNQSATNDTLSLDTWNGTTTVTPITIASSGNVGIRNTTPNYALDVDGAIFASDDILAFSDGRYKSNVAPIPNALDKVSQMNGYYYTLAGKKSVGVIAQEMLEVLPEVVTYNEPDDKYGVNYGNITAVIIEAIKELRSEVRQIKEALSKAANF